MGRFRAVIGIMTLLLCMGNVCAQNVDSLLNALKSAGHDTVKIKIYNELAETCDLPDILKYAEPVKLLCEKAIAAGEEPSKFYWSNLASAINNTGYYYSKKGDQAKALENYKKAFSIHEKIKDTVFATYALNNIAFIYDNQGDVKTALEYFYKNLRLQEEIKDTIGMAYSLNNIAFAFQHQKDFVNSRKYYDRSLLMFTAIGNKKGVAMVNGNYGVLYSDQGDAQQALAYHQKALVIYEEIHDNYSISIELSGIASAYGRLGNDSLAMDYNNRALKIAEQYHFKSVQAHALTGIARLLLKKGDVAKASDFALRSLQMGKELGNPQDIGYAAGLLKDIYQKQNNYKEALGMYELQIQMKDSVTNQSNRKETIRKQLQYDYEKRELELKLDNQRELAKRNLLVFACLLVAAVVILMAFFYTRQNKLKSQLERMELEQQQYRSQMNPHFIFNCLNSIQHFIVHNDVIAANKYLSEFASLMRKTLENNTLQSIVLQQEIDYLNNYLLLEQMRFENKFTYSIDCAADVDQFDTKLLPTVIQPFAENAIVHGLCFLDGGGRLSIGFTTAGNYLVCKIDDNGIGREASKQLKIQSGNAHVSKGMDLINKRLALASNIYKRKFEVEIIDKVNDAGRAAGTLVILKFPIGI